MSTNTQNQSPEVMSFSGWIRRKGMKQGLWHKRFMALSGSVLTISKDETLSKIENTIELKSDIKAAYIENSQPPRFQLTLPDNEPILFSTDTQEVAMKWISLINSICSPSPSLSMDQFKIISVLGRGFYGKVMLCQKLHTNELYAIKSIHKNRLIEAGKSHTVISERNIMMKAHHPFIVNLCFAFQTPSKFYLGLEYAPGGELFYYMDQAGTIPLDDIRLYIAEIGLALSYLHSIGVVYRDLKPENILFDACGHIKLTDFGLAKDILPSESTNTFCGTSEYLAPEVVMQLPYSYPIDIWALGILTYEMLFRTTPFYDENKSKLFTNIVSAEPYFPPKLDFRIVDFIKKLLTKKASDRPTFEQMKSHPFFEGFDWDKVYNRRYRPNFIPQTNDPLHPTNFDPEFTKEVAADSFVSPAIGGEANFKGFSYYETDLNNEE